MVQVEAAAMEIGKAFSFGQDERREVELMPAWSIHPPPPPLSSLFAVLCGHQRGFLRHQR